MQRVELDGHYVELLLTREGIEKFEEGQTLETRWNANGDKVYLHNMDPLPKGMDRESYERVVWLDESAKKREFAVLNGESMDIDLYVPWWVVHNQFIKATNFSVKIDDNLTFEPKKYYDYLMNQFKDLHVRLKFSP
jgi:hypothetical protein